MTFNSAENLLLCKSGYVRCGFNIPIEYFLKQGPSFAGESRTVLSSLQIV